MKNQKNIFIIIILILVIILVIFTYKNSSNKDNNNYQVEKTLTKLENENKELKNKIEKLESEKDRQNDTPAGNENGSESLNEKTCIGEFCDGSGVDNEEDLMTIKVPKINPEAENEDELIYFENVKAYKNPKVLTEVYKYLFALHHGVWNGLTFESVSIKDKTAEIHLSGNWHSVGGMSGYYFRKLIDAAALQYNTVDTVIVKVNGEMFDWCIDDMSDGEGPCGQGPQWWITSK